MKELYIPYSASVAGGLLSHLKDSGFCEADEVGEVFGPKEKGVWESVYEDNCG